MKKRPIEISSLIKLDRKLILASQSPRRRRLLEQLGFRFVIVPADVDENNSKSLAPHNLAAHLAMKKAEAVASSIEDKSIVLGADTIVDLDGRIMDKPKDKDDAVNTLKILSGNTHTVFTGIALVETPGLRAVSAVQDTRVTFRELSEEEILAYVDTGSPLDKAGAYGIQDDFGAVFVNSIQGCYYNIVGLPLELLYTTMRDFIKK